MARLGRTFLAPILRSGGRVWIDADLTVSVQQGTIPLTLPFTLNATSPNSMGIAYTADASLEVTAGLGNQFPYTFPFTFQTSNNLSKTFGSNAETEITATPTANTTLTAYDQSSGVFYAGFSANAVVSTSISASLAGAATSTPDAGRGQTLDSSLSLSAHYNSEFPYTFPLVFSSITASTTKGLVGNVSLEITGTPDLFFTRHQYADIHLEETASFTNAAWFSALLDASETITATRTEDSTRDAPVDTSLSGTASPFVDAVQGRNVYADEVAVAFTATADSSTVQYADADQSATATADADSLRNANVGMPDLLLTAEVTAEASIVAYAEADEILIVVSDSPDATRNANVDSDLAGTVTTDQAVNWDAQGLDGSLSTTADLSAQESAAALADIFAGEVTVSLTAEATRNVFCDSDEIPITATIPDEDALRNVIVDADLPVEASFTAVRSSEVFIDTDELAVTVTVTECDVVKGLIGYVDLEATADPSADVIYGQSLDADHTSTADSTAGFSRMQPLEGDLLLAADAGGSITRHQYADSDRQVISATVESDVLFGALADADLPVEASRDGTITRNHNADSPLEITGDPTGAVSFDALPDTDLPVTSSTDVDFLRDAIVDADLAVTAGTFVLVYNDAETESQLYVTVTPEAEATRNIFIDAELSATVTIESPEPSRGQLLDSDVLGIVTTDTDPLYNQFLDADMPVSNGPGGDVNFDALLDAPLLFYPTNLMLTDYTKGMSIESLLDLLAPSEERLRSDFITSAIPLTILGDTDYPFAFMGRFLDADMPVTITQEDLVNMEALLDSLLIIPASGTSGVSELLSSNFFPFYL